MPDDTPIIRRAQPADADAIVACIDAAYAQYATHICDLPPVSVGVTADIIDNQVWVTTRDQHITGCLFLVPAQGFMKLANLAVAPAHSGQGLGRALVAHAQNEAAKQGYSEIRLNTHAKMPANIRLYRHLGWQETGRDGNTVKMAKRL